MAGTVGAPVQINTPGLNNLINDMRKQVLHGNDSRLNIALDSLGAHTVEALRTAPVPPMLRKTGRMRANYLYKVKGKKVTILNRARSKKGNFAYPVLQEQKRQPTLKSVRAAQTTIIAKTRSDLGRTSVRGGARGHALRVS